MTKLTSIGNIIFSSILVSKENPIILNLIIFSSEFISKWLICLNITFFIISGISISSWVVSIWLWVVSIGSIIFSVVVNIVGIILYVEGSVVVTISVVSIGSGWLIHVTFCFDDISIISINISSVSLSCNAQGGKSIFEL